MSTNRNEDEIEGLCIQLSGAFRCLKGFLEANAYLLIKQESPNHVGIHINGRADRRTFLEALSDDSSSEKRDFQVEVNPKESLISAKYNPVKRAYALSLATTRDP